MGILFFLSITVLPCLVVAMVAHYTVPKNGLYAESGKVLRCLILSMGAGVIVFISAIIFFASFG